jgi:hypothetical protein
LRTNASDEILHRTALFRIKKPQTGQKLRAGLFFDGRKHQNSEEGTVENSSHKVACFSLRARGRTTCKTCLPNWFKRETKIQRFSLVRGSTGTKWHESETGAAEKKSTAQETRTGRRSHGHEAGAHWAWAHATWAWVSAAACTGGRGHLAPRQRTKRHGRLFFSREDT